MQQKVGWNSCRFHVWKQKHEALLLKIKPKRSGEWQQAMEFLHHFSSSPLISRKQTVLSWFIRLWRTQNQNRESLPERIWTRDRALNRSKQFYKWWRDGGLSMWRSVHVIRQIALDLDKEDRVVIAWARLAVKIKAGRDTGEIASKILQSIEGLCWKADRTQ